MNFLKSLLILSLFIIAGQSLPAQDQPYADYWDEAKTIKRSEGTYTNGLENGEWKYYYSDGILKEKATYAAGRLNGEVITYFFNGKVKEAGFLIGISRIAVLWRITFREISKKEDRSIKVIKPVSGNTGTPILP